MGLFSRKNKEKKERDTEQKPKKRSKLRKFLKWTTLTGAGVALAGTIAAASYGGYKYKTISARIGDEIQRKNIKKLLHQDTEVFFSDGRHKISSLAGDGDDTTHRKYIQIHPKDKADDSIPRHCIDSLVASEDDRFFKHSGFNFKGLTRAFYRRYVTRTSKEGGSSITQQTAENLFKSFFQNKASSLQGKIEEAVYALKLEQNYSKEEILEFYLNQFHVIGNAVGIGNAAHYYFNKDVKDLNEIECAFIVAQVKGPKGYDPYRHSGNGRKRAIRKGVDRTVYVLKNKKIEALKTAEETEKKQIIEKYNQLIAQVKKEGIPFNKGEFTFSTNTLADLVRREIEGNEELNKKLRDEGIDPGSIGTAGLRIITTIDRAVQKAAEYSLRQTATEFGLQLGGYKKLSAEFKARKPEKPEQGAFYLGKIEEIGDNQIQLDGGLIDEEALKRIVKLDKEGRLGRTYNIKITQADLDSFLRKFKKGEVIYYSVKGFSESKNPLLDIEQWPNFELASVFLDKEGRIVTLLGSYDNHDFNYIFDGKRQPGSAMKPIIDWIALEMGVNLEDKLWNGPYSFWLDRQKIFSVNNYSKSDENELTLWKALVKSKNIPHIDLIYQLYNKLSAEKFTEMAKLVGFDRQENEPETERWHEDAYFKRIRDQEGILFAPLEDWIKFNWAKGQYINNTQNSSLNKNAATQLDYGYNYEKRKTVLEKARAGQRDAALARLGNNNWTNYRAKRQDLENILQKLSTAIQHDDRNSISEYLKNFSVKEKEWEEKLASGEKVIKKGYALIFAPDSPEGLKQLESGLFDQMLDFSDPERRSKTFERKFRLEKILLGESCPAQVIDDLTKLVSNYQTPEKFTLDYVVQHPEARMTIMLRYIEKRAGELGIEIGKNYLYPNVVLGTAPQIPIVMASAYTGLFKGEIPFPFIVERIEDRKGKVLYQTKPQFLKINIDPKVSYSLAQTLHNVTTHGTAPFLNRVYYRIGKDGEVQEIPKGTVNITIDGKDYNVWTAGKTGTTNNYTNGWFVGSVGQELSDLYSGAVWIGEYKGHPKGYTRNRSIKLLGSDAAKIWGKIADQIAEGEEFRKNFDITKKTPAAPFPTQGIYVDDENGLPINEEECDVAKTKDYCLEEVEGKKVVKPVSLIYKF
ncbi:MAG: transglycosylase domain-containing protein [Candidatus Woesearchaeota archaeon]